MRLLFWRRDPMELALSAVAQTAAAFAEIQKETLALAKEARDRSDLLQAIVLSNPSTAQMLFAVTEAEEMLKAEAFGPDLIKENQP